MVSESASQDQSGSFFLLASLFDCSSCNLFFFLSLSTDIHTPCHSHINQSTRVFLAFGAFVAAIIFLLVQDTTSTVRLYAPTSGSVVVLVTFIYYYSFSYVLGTLVQFSARPRHLSLSLDASRSPAPRPPSSLSLPPHPRQVCPCQVCPSLPSSSLPLSPFVTSALLSLRHVSSSSACTLNVGSLHLC